MINNLNSDNMTDNKYKCRVKFGLFRVDRFIDLDNREDIEKILNLLDSTMVNNFGIVIECSPTSDFSFLTNKEMELEKTRRF